MSLSRGTSLLKVISKTNALQNVKNMSGHAWYYRVGVHHHSKATQIVPTIAAGAMWWWIIWHLWTEPGHITGEFPYPDTSKWTDEELGIK